MEAMGNKKGVLKSVLRQLHQGAEVAEVREKAKEALRELTPAQISEVEQELIREGLPRETLQKLCDVHLAVMQESLEKQEVSVPDWHPVHILMEEHRRLLDLAEQLVSAQREKDDRRIAHLLEHLDEAESHYLREENVLFPYLEKHGVTEPPAIMWKEHDAIRDFKKRLQKAASERHQGDLASLAPALREMLSHHFYKENNILFPTALEVMDDGEWVSVREQFDHIGYCCFTPQAPPVEKETGGGGERPQKGEISLETGHFTSRELEAVLDALPVDITFVDRDDRVRYFNQAQDRIFVRTKAILGRTVQNCHPSKSVDVVNRIVEAFKKGERDSAEFWIDMGSRKIYIRYFPVWKDGEYLGVVEVTQDITSLKEIEGQRRLLDWD
ncbi:MAG TPA: DUF438 domain-containing protein [Thermoplasmatales archaeon]|nr:DUF438 domain-containing protein [Thermoplasmatales archaeon]